MTAQHSCATLDERDISPLPGPDGWLRPRAGQSTTVGDLGNHDGMHDFYTIESRRDRVHHTTFRARCACGWTTPPALTAGLAGSVWDRHREREGASE